MLAVKNKVQSLHMVPALIKPILTWDRIKKASGRGCIMCFDNMEEEKRLTVKRGSRKHSGWWRYWIWEAFKFENDYRGLMELTSVWGNIPLSRKLHFFEKRAIRPVWQVGRGITKIVL